MINLNSTTDKNSSLSLDQLLLSFGFTELEMITASFILLPICFMGACFCSLSAWIFYRPKFRQTSFFYYRVLCLVSVLHLLHGIPYGLFFSPRYLPSLDMYWTCVFRIYYNFISPLLFHFEDTLQMAILLDRMAIFNKFVKKHFKASPQIISASFFVTCLLIDLPFAFSLKVAPIGTFSFLVGETVQSNVTFYVGVSSDFASSPFGRILVGITTVILNLTLTQNIGMALNFISVRQYRAYLSNRRPLERQDTSSQSVKVSKKQRSEQKAERNLFVMALTLSSISTGSRFIFACCYVNYFFFFSLATEFAVTLILYIGYTLGPTASILVFYSYNKIFRQEVKATILRRRATSITYTS
jgi:uncharacterized protein YneF (UPF0154 family)